LRTWLLSCAFFQPACAVGAQTNTTEVAQIRSIEHVRDAAALIPAAISKSGVLVVSRFELSAMDIFDRSGAFLGRIPRPDDHLSLVPPAPIAITQTEEILTFDFRSGRLVHYVIRNGNLTLSRMQRLEKSYTDMCLLGDTLVMFTPEIGGALDLVPLEGEKVSRSIQTSSRRSLIEQPLNEARIACDAPSQMIIVANSLDGSVTGLSPSAHKNWRVGIRGLRLQGIELQVGRSMKIIPPVGEYHSLIQCVGLGKGLILLQYLIHSSRRPPWGTMPPLLTVVLAVNNGQEVSRSSNIPLIIAAADKRIAYLGRGGQLIVGSTSAFVDTLPSLYP
jgi:hypothetical protein